MDALAARAGTSRRTLYRYFPTRSALLAATGDWIYERHIRLPAEIQTVADIVSSFEDASHELAQHRRLARVLVDSDVGRSMRSPLRAVTTHLTDDEAAEAAVIVHLCRSRARDAHRRSAPPQRRPSLVNGASAMALRAMFATRGAGERLPCPRASGFVWGLGWRRGQRRWVGG